MHLQQLHKVVLREHRHAQRRKALHGHQRLQTPPIGRHGLLQAPPRTAVGIGLADAPLLLGQQRNVVEASVVVVVVVVVLVWVGGHRGSEFEVHVVLAVVIVIVHVVTTVLCVVAWTLPPNVVQHVVVAFAARRLAEAPPLLHQAPLPLLDELAQSAGGVVTITTASLSVIVAIALHVILSRLLLLLLLLLGVLDGRGGGG
mmetsp:Transcript_35504/g.88240  ORF Transcript_35504/g.88240 Transcript_35504/m.88240 type:complete len:201 (+) Transcript_35504:1219-1821(+)